MKIDEMTPTQSRYLTKNDVGEDGVNLTIKGFELATVGQGPDAEEKWTIIWTNPNFKPMVLNKENGSRLKMVCKTDDTDQMIGVTVNVYSDPFVAFGGKTVGGLRIRTAKGLPQSGQKPKSQPTEADMGGPNPPIEAYGNEPDDSDVPF